MHSRKSMHRIAVAAALVLMACGEHPTVTEISYSIDESDDCQAPSDEEMIAVVEAAKAWAPHGVTVTEGGEGHPVAVCFQGEVADGKPGYRTVGHTVRDDDATRILVEAGRGYQSTREVVRHEFMHVVTWSGDHADGHGALSCCTGGAGDFTSDDVGYLATFGL